MMGKTLKISLALILLLAVFFSLVLYYGFIDEGNGNAWENGTDLEEPQQPFLESNGMAEIIIPEKIEDGFLPPMDAVAERISKKPFGIFITPETSPVRPDKFTGYHTAIDLEVFPEELEAEVRVPVRAICSGELLAKRVAGGYGGVAVQACELENEPITVIYGHMKLSSIEKNAGDNIEAGEVLGVLGNGFSVETDGARKHLHLGIHKGSELNILGYVQNQSHLSAWIDPCLLVCGRGGE